MQPAVEQFLPDAQKQQRRGLADKKNRHLAGTGFETTDLENSQS